MQQVYEDLKDADAVIVASPIYMMQMTAQTKLLTDRLFPLIDRGFNPRYGHKKAVMVYSQGNGDPDAMNQYIDYTASGFKVLGMDIQNVIIHVGGNDPKSAGQNERIMHEAYETGKMLVG